MFVIATAQINLAHKMHCKTMHGNQLLTIVLFCISCTYSYLLASYKGTEIVFKYSFTKYKCMLHCQHLFELAYVSII